MNEKYLTSQEVKNLIGRAEQTLANDRHMGRGLPYVKFGRSVRYPYSAVLDYMNKRMIIPKN